MTTFIINKRTDALKNWRQFVFYNNKKPKLIFKGRKEMQESKIRISQLNFIPAKTVHKIIG